MFGHTSKTVLQSILSISMLHNETLIKAFRVSNFREPCK